MNGTEERGGRNSITFIKVVIYAAVVFLFGLLQTSFCPRISFFGAVPQLLLAFVCAAAYFRGARTGAVLGATAGFIADALGGAAISLLALFYALIGWFIGFYTAERRQRQPGSFGGWCIWLAAGCGAGAVITMIMLIVTAGKLNIFSATWQIILPEILNTYLWGLPLGVVYVIRDNKKRT